MYMIRCYNICICYLWADIDDGDCSVTVCINTLVKLILAAEWVRC